MRKNSYFHMDEDQLKDDINMPLEQKIDTLISASTTASNLTNSSPYINNNVPSEPLTKDILFDALKIISSLQIDYCLIGALAVIYYGCVRATRDADFIALIDNKEILKQKQEELTKSDYQVEYRKGDFNDPVGDMLVIKKGNIKVDIILATKILQKNTVKNAHREDYLGYDLRIASPEDLILLKLVSGSYMDLYDVQNIYRSLKDKLNLDYIDDNSKQFKCHKEWNRIKEEG